jgi:hypothetical protein
MVQLPGWNSVDVTAQFHDFFEFWGIVLFFVVVVFELGAFFYGHRRDALVEQAASVANAALKEADERHQEETARLSKELAEARAGIGTAQTDAATAKAGMAQAQADAAEAKARSAPRHLTEAQKQALVSALSKFPGTKIAVESLLGSDDGKVYRDEFVDVFNKAGWAMDNHIGEGVYDRNPVGIAIRMRQSEVVADRIPAGVVALLETLAKLQLVQLRNGKLPMDLDAQNAGPEGRAVLVVGTKPPA